MPTRSDICSHDVTAISMGSLLPSMKCTSCCFCSTLGINVPQNQTMMARESVLGRGRSEEKGEKGVGEKIAREEWRKASKPPLPMGILPT